MVFALVCEGRFCFYGLSTIFGERRNTRLAITREQKAQIYQNYLDILGSAQGMVVTEYRGMSMKGLTTTRNLLRGMKGTFNITKNTIFKIALRETGFAAPEELLSGPVAVAIAYGDLSALTKAMIQRAKEDELLILKGAIMGTTVFRADQLEALSTMPTLDEARAQLIGTLQQPASRFVGLLAQPGQGLAALLKAYTDKSEEAA